MLKRAVHVNDLINVPTIRSERCRLLSFTCEREYRITMHIAMDVADAAGARLSYNAAGESTWIFTPSDTPFSIKPTVGSGLGLFAARDIQIGERLLAEFPLATWFVANDCTRADRARSFASMSAKLSSRQIRAISALSQSPIYGEKTLLGTWQTNGLPIRYESDERPGTTTSQLSSKKEAALFPTVCRLNHSCRPCWYRMTQYPQPRCLAH